VPDELFKLGVDNLEVNKANNLETNYTSSRLFTSKIYNFENLSESRNATEGKSVYYFVMILKSLF
jgi:hypothetical protein